MTKKHAKFGSPSGLYALQECPAKIAFGKDLPEPPESVYAKEGTVFHDIIERCIPAYFNGNQAKVDSIIKECPAEYEDMPDFVESSLKQLFELWGSFQSKHTNPKYHVELQVKLSEDIFGTSDVVFTGRNKKSGKIDVVALDWKYGMGVVVKADGNLQGITYGLGAISTLEIPRHELGICMVIIAQVRLSSDWDRFTFEGDEVAMYTDKVFAIVEKAKSIYAGKLPIEGNMKAGSHCRFCKALPVCPEQKKSTLELITATATELPLEELVKKLTLDEQAEIFLKKSIIEDFLKAVANNLRAALETGVTHPALKLVKTSGRRSWKDEDDIAEKLIERGVKDPYKKKLIGITEVEKEIGKKRIDDLTVLSEGRTELVTHHDKRDAVAINGLSELPE